MAKKKEELLFESERQERKAQRRRQLLPLVIFLAVLAVLVLVILLLRSQQPELHTLEGETLYPVTWTEGEDGSLILRISHQGQPEYRWTLARQAEPSPALSVERLDQEKEDTTRFLLTPKEEGRANLQVELARDEDSDDVVQSMDFLLQVDLKEGEEPGFTIQILTYKDKTGIGVITGGGDTAAPFRISKKVNGDMVITVTNGTTNQDWEITSSQEESVQILGLDYTDEAVLAYLRAGETPGEGEVTLWSGFSGLELHFIMKSSEDGSLELVSHELRSIEKQDGPVDQEDEFILEADVKPSGENAQTPTQEETEKLDSETTEETQAETKAP